MSRVLIYVNGKLLLPGKARVVGDGCLPGAQVGVVFDAPHEDPSTIQVLWFTSDFPHDDGRLVTTMVWDLFELGRDKTVVTNRCCGKDHRLNVERTIYILSHVTADSWTP